MNTHVSEQPDIATRIRGAFPASLADDVAAVLKLIPIAQIPPSTDDTGPVHISREQLRIPFRFYSEIPGNFKFVNLELRQQAIMSCIYTRHHDGYVRQEFTGYLINASQIWGVPYLLQLVGEYVCEIAELILAQLSNLNHEMIAQFAAENPQFIALTRHRVISYWDTCYRSRFRRFTDYPGYLVMDALELWCKNVSPRLLSR